MAASSKYQAPKGTRDFYPVEMARRRHLEDAWRRASIVHGFDEVDGPTFEHLELYTAKSGPGIVSELFSFRRSGGENDYAMRPEFTPTLARMVAAKAGSLPLPVKWFAIPSQFRAERPQRGRLREFFMWNVDLIGTGGEAADVEVISVAIRALESLGLSPRDVCVRVSHRGAVGAILASLGVGPENAAAAVEILDKRDRTPVPEFAAKAKGLGFDADRFTHLAAVAAGEEGAEAAGQPGAASVGGIGERLAALTKHAPGLKEGDMAPLQAVAERLRAASLDEWCRLDLGIVRGLAYYTGTVFEVHAVAGGSRAVAGGGRYDGLVELFGGPPMPAVGFGMGDVVLSLLLAERNLLPPDEALLPRPDAFLIAASETGATQLLAIATRLRRAGLHVRHSYRSTQNVGKLLGEAAKSRARYAVILGGQAGEHAAEIKDMDAGTQSAAPLSELEARVRGAGGA